MRQKIRPKLGALKSQSAHLSSIKGSVAAKAEVPQAQNMCQDFDLKEAG